MDYDFDDRSGLSFGVRYSAWFRKQQEMNRAAVIRDSVSPDRGLSHTPIIKRDDMDLDAYRQWREDSRKNNEPPFSFSYD